MPSKSMRSVPQYPNRGELQRLLRGTFGLEQLREGQLEVMESVLDGHDTLAVMPTGAGKSLCFQLPALIMPGSTIVVSPLIALMKDQTEKLEELELEALELNSSLTESEQAANLRAAAKGKAEFLYVTPERLTNPEFLESVKKMNIDFMVIDEAHCISQWGHDFRPAFLGIREAWMALGQPTLLALTATATAAVIEDIRQALGAKDLRVFQTGVFRKNLHYEVKIADREEEKDQQLLDTVRASRGPGIIYCASIKAVEKIYEILKAEGLSATRYHGKLPKKERGQNQDLFMSGEVPWIVATNAFGMGIDKADIRSVIHYQFPGSLESYYQESGRAGRDGKDSTCTLLYWKGDKKIHNFFLAGKFRRDEMKIEDFARRDAEEEKLKQMIIYSQSALCRWKILMRYFGEKLEEPCQFCDSCKKDEARQHPAPKAVSPAEKEDDWSIAV